MKECLLWDSGHRVAVEGQKRQFIDPGEGLLRQSPNQVEAEIQNLEKDQQIMICANS